MSLLFALVVSVCVAVIAVLFITMCLDGEMAVTTALAAALLSTLVLALLAWDKAL